MPQNPAEIVPLRIAVRIDELKAFDEWAAAWGLDRVKLFRIIVLYMAEMQDRHEPVLALLSYQALHGQLPPQE